MTRAPALLLAATLAVAPPAAAQRIQAITQGDRSQGQQAHPQLLEQFGGAMTGPQATYVEQIGRRVAGQSGLANAERDFTITLLNSPVENALAIPGGYVYITRQLLGNMNSEDELAFVLGHEVGHVAARHSAGRQNTSGIASVLAGVVGAVAGNSGLGQLLGAGAQQAAGLFTLRYGRNQEFQADQLGVRYVAAGGYDPFAAPEVLSQLDASSTLQARAAGRTAQPVASWLSTHPSSAERVRRAADLARQTGRAPGAATQDAAFLRRLDGLRYDDDPNAGIIDGQTFRHPELRFRFVAPNGYNIVNAASSVTVAGQGGQAQLMVAQGTDLAAAVRQRFAALGGGNAAVEVRNVTIGGRPAAIANTVAQSGRTRVDATVIATNLGGRAYSWTVVTPAGQGIGPFAPVVESFQPLTAAEAGQVRGRVIRVVTVGANDTVDTLSRRMAYPTLQRERFLTINGLAEGETLRAGSLVKLVVAG